jgi:modulator of FtsH protease HflC
MERNNMRAFFAFILTVLGVAAVALYSSAFIVHQNEQALVLRFGNPQQVITAPGLKWKVPFIDTVEKFDKRILDLDTTEQEVTASDQQRLIVTAYARYRITDQLKFYQNVRYEDRVREVVGPLIESEIRRVLGSATLQEVVKDKRESLMEQIAAQVNKEGREYGLEVVDVRIKRADLPKENLVKVYDRMRADRVREATELRAQGEAESNRVRANADKAVTIIKATATQKSDEIRGDGEAKRSRIFAEAFGQDPDFFRFYRSMQAYTTALKPGDTRLLLSPKSDFFRYFEDPNGRAPASASSSLSPQR